MYFIKRWNPTGSSPYYNVWYPVPVYGYPYYANPAMYNSRIDLYTALETPSAINDLSALTEIYEKSKPLVEKTEALANKIFPHDGQPIVQGNIIRTKFGNRK